VERKQFPLRLPPDLWAELERWAADELRSVNGQIEYLLREAVRKQRLNRPPELPPGGRPGSHGPG
jgi:hypothetical protein